MLYKTYSNYKIKMPILQIDTNLSILTIPIDFKVKMCELMADIFNSPLNVRL